MLWLQFDAGLDLHIPTTVKPLFFSRESIFRGRPPCKIPRGPMFARFFYYNHTIWQFFAGLIFADFQKIAKSAKNRPPAKKSGFTVNVNVRLISSVYCQY